MNTTANIIIANNPLTAKRMAVIASRTSSELMAGAKSMMIETLKKQMRNGIAHFIFMKKDGSLREAWGTTNRSLAEKYNDDIIIYKVNTDEERELAAAFGITSLPTPLFRPMDEIPQMAQGVLLKKEL